MQKQKKKTGGQWESEQVAACKRVVRVGFINKVKCEQNVKKSESCPCRDWGKSIPGIGNS